MYQYVLNHRAKRKEEIVYVMGGKCQLCGYCKCIKALECHHINPEEKEEDFGNLCKNWENIKIELKKCVLVCANCHREIHDNINQYLDLQSSFDEKKAEEISLKISQLKSRKIFYCKNCGKIISSYHNLCKECSAYSKRKVERPSHEQLKNDMKTMSMAAIGKKYGVTDNAVRKWLKKYRETEE